jgi:hypothetical protein
MRDKSHIGLVVSDGDLLGDCDRDDPVCNEQVRPCDITGLHPVKVGGVITKMDVGPPVCIHLCQVTSDASLSGCRTASSLGEPYGRLTLSGPQ